jgi:hypothetical protein
MIITILFVLLGVGVYFALTGGSGGSASGEFRRLTNVGIGHLENRQATDAITAFEAALKLRPDDPLAHRNLARALMLKTEPERAIESLQRAWNLDQENTATNYLLGIAYLRVADFEKAKPFLARAVKADPDTPAVQYQMAMNHEFLNEIEDAEAAFKQTLQLDPLHVSSHHHLQTIARRAEDRETFQYHFDQVRRLRGILGDEGRNTESLEKCEHTMGERPPAEAAKAQTVSSIPVTFVATPALAALDDTRVACMCVIEAHEGYEVFAATDEGKILLLSMGTGGKFQVADATGLPAGFVPSRCFVGDFHNDVPADKKYDPKLHRRNDVLLLGADSLVLLKREDETTFLDVTESAGLSGISAATARWVDADHDGDLDLALGGEFGLQLWQNNGDAAFENVSSSVGLPELQNVSAITAVDINRDVAVDLAVSCAEQTSLITNSRLGTFSPDTESLPPARDLSSDDYTGDGLTNYALLQDNGLAVYGAAGKLLATTPDSGGTSTGMTTLDFDNDGHLDVLLFGDGLTLLCGVGGGRFENVSAPTGIGTMKLAGIKSSLPADFDSDGDTDVILLDENGKSHYQQNNGGNAHHQLRITVQAIKSNPTGVNVEVQVYRDDFQAMRVMHDGYAELGIGEKDSVDSVRTLWTNGVVDHLLGTEIGGDSLLIVEKNVATGSCPFLYAWDGSGYRFVTDILGNSPVGLSLARGKVLPADPDEFVFIGHEENFPPHNGRYRLDVTEEFREVLYLDFGSLFVVDHAPDVEIHATDKLMPEPFPKSELWPLSSPRPPRVALGDDGIDRTGYLAAIDGEFAPSGQPLPPPYRGMCRPMTLTMDLGEIDTTAPLVLALTGWLQYGDASTNIALSQSRHVTVIPPSLEAELPDGSWKPIDVVIGMPAGKTKTILTDLSGRLPQGTRRLRLTNTFEIYWDRIALMSPVDAAQIVSREIRPESAQLRWRGFSEIKSRAPLHPTTPAYDDVSDWPPWRTTLQGWCTRYGDVDELVQDVDGKVVVINAGDAIELFFDATSLPPLAEGMTRSFFFYSHGWDKDGDHNVVGGNRVEPLPVEHQRPPWGESWDEEVDDWRVRYNTRWVSEFMFDPQINAD